MVNGTLLLNFGKRYKDNLRVHFWSINSGQRHIDLDALSNQNILKGIYFLYTVKQFQLFFQYFSVFCSADYYSIGFYSFQIFFGLLAVMNQISSSIFMFIKMAFFSESTGAFVIASNIWTFYFLELENLNF